MPRRASRLAAAALAWLTANGATAQAGDAGTAVPTPAEAAAQAVAGEGPAAPTAPQPAQPESFGATAHVAPVRANDRRVDVEVARELPGAFGDPFRVLDSLPGVVPVLSGLPYVYVRGAPPAGTVYYYDGIQVPTLFHLALGPAVVHPAMIGTLNFYPSVAPARYGRFTGGVVEGEGPPTALPEDRARGEAELRLVDVMGMAQVPIAGGSLSLAGRYGYPGLILSALSPTAVLAYWDYQTRLVLPISDSDRVELSWFGAYDHAGAKNPQPGDSDLTLEFHRAEARLIRKVGALEFGAMLQAGYERSLLAKESAVNAARLGPRTYVAWRDPSGVRLRVGADLLGTVGSLRNASADSQNHINFVNPAYTSVAARSTSGLYSELHVPLAERWALDAGLRSDLWLSGSHAQVAADPRGTLSYQLHERVALHAAVGLAHQPAVFLIPLPGVTDVALDHGLQSAVQSEAGAAFDLGSGVHLESQLYLQRFTDMILPEAVIDDQTTCGDLPLGADGTFGCNRESFPRSSVWAYGLELFLRRDISKRLSGWISYTLGWADARADRGYDFTPSFDIRHVANLVLAYRFGGGFSLGTRFQYRSGKMASHTFVRATPIHYEQRLPDFARADAELAYAWNTSYAAFRVALEWFNVTIAREALNIDCIDGVQTGSNPLSATPCKVRYAPALFFPNLGLRAKF